VPESNFQALREDFVALCGECLPEQRYQEYLEANTQLIPREFIQNHGVHLDLVIRKLSMAADYTTDFFYLSKSSVEWNCVLIELEKPQSKYFKDGSNDFHSDFVAALSQIAKWRAWFDNRANFDGFVDSTIAPIRVPLKENRCRIKYVLVHGRRAEYEGHQVRTALIGSQSRDDFRIMSFDALSESLHSKRPLYLGIRKNEFIEIRSSEFLGEGLFSWVNAASLRITPQLRSNIEAARGSWFHYRSRGVLVLDEVLPRIGSCAA